MNNKKPNQDNDLEPQVPSPLNKPEVGPEVSAHSEEERLEARAMIRNIHLQAIHGFELASAPQPIVAKGQVVAKKPDYGAMAMMLDRAIQTGRLLGESAGDIGEKANKLIEGRTAEVVAQINKEAAIESAKAGAKAGLGGLGGITNVERLLSVVVMPKTAEAEAEERRILNRLPPPSVVGAVKS